MARQEDRATEIRQRYRSRFIKGEEMKSPTWKRLTETERKRMHLFRLADGDPIREKVLLEMQLDEIAEFECLRTLNYQIDNGK